MGHIFQAKRWEKHPSGCDFSLLMAKEISKGISNDKEAIIGIYFLK